MGGLINVPVREHDLFSSSLTPRRESKTGEPLEKLEHAVWVWTIETCPQINANMAGITYLRGDATAPRGTGNQLIAQVVNDSALTWVEGFHWWFGRRGCESSKARTLFHGTRASKSNCFPRCVMAEFRATSIKICGEPRLPQISS